ncbi:MAG: hypothetical protein ACI95T_000774 [Flavobacteriales bacterium]|jgi:hypothetical protein|tara:strand:+ start:622 stop:1065 length:444 start_codon:yes stop_codon:yes gene_type:complete
MKKTIKLIPVIFASILIFGTSCNKYEDGPKLSLRSKKARMTNTWKIITATDADDDVTAGYEGITWTFTEDGSYTRGGETAAGFEPNETGKWEFGKIDGRNKTQLIISTDGIVTPKKWIITRLKNDELWLKQEQAQDTYETRKLEGQD